MRMQAGFHRIQGGLRMRLIAVLAAAVVALNGVSAVRAGSTLMYSFESGDDGGFINNSGAGVDNEVAVDTIGATQGTGSLKFGLLQQEFFAGILTTLLDPAFNDPPGVDFILLDLTIPQAFADPAGFARMSVTAFGFHPSLGGVQAQFLNNEVSIGNLAAGTYPIRINLSAATQFNNKSFNELFGPPDDPTQLTVTGFQIYVNKSATAPLTLYFDNIRAGSYNADFNNDGKVDGLDLAKWKTDFGKNGGSDADGDGLSDGADILIWQRQLHPVAGIAAVPEPATTALGGAALLSLLWRARNRRRSP